MNSFPPIESATFSLIFFLLSFLLLHRSLFAVPRFLLFSSSPSSFFLLSHCPRMLLPAYIFAREPTRIPAAACKHANDVHADTRTSTVLLAVVGKGTSEGREGCDDVRRKRSSKRRRRKRRRKTCRRRMRRRRTLSGEGDVGSGLKGRGGGTNHPAV